MSEEYVCDMEEIRKQVKSSNEDEIVVWINDLVEYNTILRGGLVLAQEALNLAGEKEKERECEEQENHHLERLMEENLSLNETITSLRRHLCSCDNKYHKLESDFIVSQAELKQAKESIKLLEKNIELLERRCNELEKNPNVEDIEDEEEKSMVIKLMENLNNRHEFETKVMVERFNNIKPLLEQLLESDFSELCEINTFTNRIDRRTKFANDIYNEWDLPQIQTYASFNICPFIRKPFVTDIVVTKHHGEGWGITEDQRIYECFSPLTIYYSIDEHFRDNDVFTGGVTEYVGDKESYEYRKWYDEWKSTIQREDTYFPSHYNPVNILTPYDVVCANRRANSETKNELEKGVKFFENKINEICESFGMRHNESYPKEIQNPLNAFYFNLIRWVMYSIYEISNCYEVFRDLKEYTTPINEVEAQLYPNMVGVTDASLQLWFDAGAEEIQGGEHHHPFSNNSFIEEMWRSGEITTSEIKELCEESSTFEDTIENPYKNGNYYFMAIKCLENPKWMKIFKKRFSEDYKDYIARFKDESPTYQNEPDDSEAEHPYEDGMRMKDYYYRDTNISNSSEFSEAFDFLLKFVKKSYEKYGDILHKIKHRSGASSYGITYFNYDMCYELLNDECKLDKEIHTKLMSEFRKKRRIDPNDLVSGGLKNYELDGIFPDKEESLYFAKSIIDKIAYKY